MVFGPGLIVMVADNDAGAVSTYTQAGAQYGTATAVGAAAPAARHLFLRRKWWCAWASPPGAATRPMIYQRFGKWWGRFSLWDLELVNFLTLVTEFAAINTGAQHGGHPGLSSPCPIAAVRPDLHGRHRQLPALGAHRRRAVPVQPGLDRHCALAAAGAGSLLSGLLVPQVPAGGLTGSLIFLVIAIVGTTIAPWQLFFQQSCVADKRLRFRDLNRERLDTFLGAIFTIVNAGCHDADRQRAPHARLAVRRSGADGGRCSARSWAASSSTACCC